MSITFASPVPRSTETSCTPGSFVMLRSRLVAQKGQLSPVTYMLTWSALTRPVVAAGAGGAVAVVGSAAAATTGAAGAGAGSEAVRCVPEHPTRRSDEMANGAKPRIMRDGMGVPFKAGAGSARRERLYGRDGEWCC